MLFSLEYNSDFLCQFDVSKFSEISDNKLALLNAVITLNFHSRTVSAKFSYS